MFVLSFKESSCYFYLKDNVVYKSMYEGFFKCSFMQQLKSKVCVVVGGCF